MNPSHVEMMFTGDELKAVIAKAREPLIAVLREIYNNVPRLTYVLEQPDGFPAPHYDIWLHDLIDSALEKPGAGLVPAPKI